MKWSPLNVKWEATCETSEEFELFADFVKEMKALKESRPHKSEWDEQCRCGHKHSEHHPIASHNYSAGHCRVDECRCKHFLMPTK